MAIVTIPVISILLLTLVPQIHILTEMLLIPYAIRLVIAIAITVLLMTYLLMPPSNESISLGYSILSKNIDLNVANYFIY